MAKQYDQRIVIKANDKPYMHTLKQLKSRTLALNKTFDKFANVAKRALISIGLPLGLATKEYASFEEALVRAGLAAGANKKELAAMEKEARKVGATTQRTATDAARALEKFSLAGFSVKQSLALLRPAVNQAVIANQDVVESAEQVSTAYKIFGGEVENAGRFVEGLTFLQNNLQANVDELSYDLSLAGGAAKQMGLDFANTAAAAGILREVLKDKAGTGLRAMLSVMQKNHAVMREYGIAVFDVNGKTRDFADILQDVENSLKGKSEQQKADILSAIMPNVRAQAALNVLLSAGSDKYRDLAEATRTSSGVVESWTKRLEETLSGYWRTFISALGETGIATIDKWADSMKRGLAAATKAVRWLGENAETLAFIISRSFNFAVALLSLSLFGKAIFGLRLAFAAAKVSAASFWAVATLGVSVLIAFFPEIIAWLEKIGVDFDKVGRFIAKHWKIQMRVIEYWFYRIKGVGIDAISEIEWYWARSIRAITILWKEAMLKFQNTMLSLFETFNEFAGWTGMQKDLADTKWEVMLLEKEIENLNNQEITLETSEATAKAKALRQEIAALSRGENVDAVIDDLPPDEGGGGVGDADDWQAAFDDDSGDTGGGGGDAGGGGDMGERGVAGMLGIEPTQENLDLIREQLKERAAVVAEEKENELKELIRLQVEHDEAMETIRSKHATNMEKLNAVKYTKEYKGLKQAQGHLLALEAAGFKQAGALAKAAALADMALKLATEPPAAFSKTYAAFGYPLGAVLAPLAALATAASIVNAKSSIQSVGFSEGGLATGGIPGKDSIQAMLTPGEVVVPEENFNDLKEAILSEDEGKTINITLELDGKQVTQIVLDRFTDEGVI